MTIRASGTKEPAPPERAPAAVAPSAVTHLHSGVIVGGTLNGDVIVMSSQALAIVKAGRLVRAFVISGLEMLRRTLAIGAGLTLSLEYGIYRTV